MHPQMNLLRGLSPAEKLQIVEELWDDLAECSEPLPLRDWHRKVAQERAAELDADHSLLIDRRELWQQVDCK